MNSYEIKQQERRERLQAAAAKAQRESDARFKRASDMASVIPFGQPILVGHHSEKRDRAYRGRIHANMDKGCELAKQAEALKAKAAAVGSGGISSDDPDAVKKLGAELEDAKKLQVVMVKANKVVRAFYNAGVRDAASGEAWDRYLVKIREVMPNIDEGRAMSLLQPDFCGRKGFPDYQLQNNSANIRRIEARIKQLESRAGIESSEEQVGPVRIVQNAEDNRLQLFFPGKPAEEVRAELKGYGFRWAPSVGAWQRHLSNAAIYYARIVAAKVPA